MNENRGCWAAQKLSRESCPGLRTLGSLWHNQGWGLKMTMLLIIPRNLDMVTAAAATPIGKESLRHSLCGLWFRVQGSAPDWLRPDHMSKLCRWKSLESKCLAFSASIVRGEQWALTSAETQDGVFHTSGEGFCGWAAEIWQMSSITPTFKFCSIILASLMDFVINKNLQNWPSALVTLIFSSQRCRWRISVSSEKDESSAGWIWVGAFLGGCDSGP